MSGGDRLAGRRALITGAGRGIGLAIAELFAREGSDVILADRDASVLHQALERLRSAGLQCRGIALDVTREAAWAGLAGGHEPIDILVNNAGILVNEPFGQLGAASLDDIWHVNVRGVMLGMNWALQTMSAGGVVLNISSTAAYMSAPGYSAYCATKAAVERLTKVAAQEAGPRGIRVNCIYPGNVDTAMVSDIAASMVAGGHVGDVDAAKGILAGSCALGRIAQPLDIARAAVFLCSEEASFITGAGLAVDGGTGLI